MIEKIAVLFMFFFIFIFIHLFEGHMEEAIMKLFEKMFGKKD